MGVTIEIVTSPSSFCWGGETAATFGSSSRRVRDLGRDLLLLLLRCLRSIDNHGEQTVEAGAEALGQEVVGLALGVLGRLRAAIRQARASCAQPARRPPAAAPGRRSRPPAAGVSRSARSARSPSPGRGPRRRGRNVSTRFCRVTRLPSEAEHRRQQRRRDQDGDDHGARRGEAHHGQERDAAPPSARPERSPRSCRRTPLRCRRCRSPGRQPPAARARRRRSGDGGRG